MSFFNVIYCISCSYIEDKLPPLLSCNAELLIGFNCARALAPKKVLLGKDNEPFAIQMDLGWSIVGSFTSESNETETSLCHRVMVKERSSVALMDMISVKDGKVKDERIPQKDQIFLDKRTEKQTKTQ